MSDRQRIVLAGAGDQEVRAMFLDCYSLYLTQYRLSLVIHQEMLSSY